MFRHPRQVWLPPPHGHRAPPLKRPPSVRILDGVMLPPESNTELALPAFDPKALARRAALPLAAAAVAAAVLVLAGGPLHAFTDALKRAVDADPRWVLAAVGFEIVSFSGYIALLWLVGERATPRMDLRASAQVTLAGAAAHGHGVAARDPHPADLPRAALRGLPARDRGRRRPPRARPRRLGRPR